MTPADANRYIEPAVVRRQYAETAAAPSRPGLAKEPDGTGIAEYWRILRRHKVIGIGVSLFGLLMGLLVSFIQTPIYQTKASLEIIGINENFLNLKQASPVTDASSQDVTDIRTQIRVLQSDFILDRVISKLKERKHSKPVSPDRNEVQLGQQRENDLKGAAQSLKVHATPQTRIIEITIDSANPQLAADFANALCNEYTEQNLESRWKTAERASGWLAGQLTEMRIKLEHSEDALQSYARNSGLVFTQEKTNVSDDKLHQLQQQVSTAQAERMARQSRYEIAQSSPPDTLPDVLNDSGLREVQSKITELQREAAEFSVAYTPEHTKVKRVQAQISALQSAFDQKRAAILDRIRNEYKESERNEKLLTVAYDAQTRLVTGQGEKAIQYNILKREVDSNRQLYETILQQLKESSIASALRASNIRVLDSAKVPLHPYKPDKTKSAGLGLLAGFLAGAASIIMRERANRTIQEPGDSSFYLTLPELGVIPTTNPCGHALPVDPVRNQAELVNLQSRASTVAESFRATLISMLFTEENGTRPKIFALTSAGPAEGKSTVASNLGIAIAQVDKKVLLIDADFRRPRQHQIFQLSNERGLSTLLDERTNLNGDRSLNALIRPTEIPGLSVLTSGPGASAATSLLYGSHMPELLRYVRAQFDIVLIDTPPMLQISDARLLGLMADRVILVLRAGRTTRDAAMAAWQRLNDDGAKVLGTILNDWNPKSAPNGRYAYYWSENRYAEHRFSGWKSQD